jgi:uncharacterized Fe-S cluster-containing radical SAM superfamily protein
VILLLTGLFAGNKEMRTHYTDRESASLIRQRFPSVSAIAVIEIRKRNKIIYTSAGAEVLISASEHSRLVDAILAEIPFLIEKNGFLVFS